MNMHNRPHNMIQTQQQSEMREGRNLLLFDFLVTFLLEDAKKTFTISKPEQSLQVFLSRGEWFFKLLLTVRCSFVDTCNHTDSDGTEVRH